ncbi:plastocyanin [Halovivax ruber XH-70]|uniref:Plastocyanin n=1 Tax=Halovivax ruber (strain DSM 18193 / JCM 13892 / XH-70) TaxID=797302 RepID=L0IHL3_HALRX|nr:plastocyanin/azurin family copper-binding protein [Halovivax ruber]AGB17467.1 plastocyanin [Halovivax ruber XH-70]
MTPHCLTRRDALGTSVGLAGIVLAGCLDRGDETAEPENAGELGTPTDRITVTTTSRPFPEFDPQIVHVSEGATVEWVVETGRHDVAAYHRDTHPPHRTPDGIEPWGSARLSQPGETFEHTFEREGVYDYVDTQQVCTSHEVAGNIGRVVVGWPDPDAEPAMDDPPAEMPQRAINALSMFNERTRPVLDAGP